MCLTNLPVPFLCLAAPPRRLPRRLAFFSPLAVFPAPGGGSLPPSGGALPLAPPRQGAPERPSFLRPPSRIHQPSGPGADAPGPDAFCLRGTGKGPERMLRAFPHWVEDIMGFTLEGKYRKLPCLPGELPPFLCKEVQYAGKCAECGPGIPIPRLERLPRTLPAGPPALTGGRRTAAAGRAENEQRREAGERRSAARPPAGRDQSWMGSRP